MSEAMIVPSRSELEELPVEVTQTEDPWVVALTSNGADGSLVRLTWDEVARSATVWWFSADRELLRIERETITRIYVGSLDGELVFEIASASEGIAGKLQVRVGEGVTISDAVLRT